MPCILIIMDTHEFYLKDYHLLVIPDKNSEPGGTDIVACYHRSGHGIRSFLLPGHGNCPAIFKRDISRELKTQFCVHNASDFHAFDHLAFL
jgi:hypothetical protein